MSGTLREKYIGDKSFYKMVLTIAVPMLIQNGLSNFVSLLDNIMIGRVGTEQMAGAAIANQLMFIFYLCIFGGLAGAGIFTAQFYGNQNMQGVRNTFRAKLWIGALVVVGAGVVFIFFGEPLIHSYLSEDTADAAATLVYGKQYLRIMLFGMIPFALSQNYASTLRETGETVLPMVSGIVAILVNLCLNYVLIFGHFGAPAMGVVGAAIATVISRFAELGVLMCSVHLDSEKYPFIIGAYRSIKIPLYLTKKIITKGMPLMLNELLWSSGVAIIAQCYSLRGLDVVPAQSIASTISNLFNVVFLSLGNSLSIIVGQRLGAGEIEEAKKLDTKLIFFDVCSCFVIGGIMIAVSPLLPQIYNTTHSVRALATQFIMVAAALMPFSAFAHCCYFTLRSGGKTLITFVFDSLFMWVVSIPLAYCLGHFSSLPILPMYICVQGVEILKCIIGYFLLHSGKWASNMVAHEK